MPEIEASIDNVVPSMPFVFFSAPTALPALAAIIPSAELYVMKNGTVVGSRWKRAYAAKEECEAAKATVLSLLKPYFPAEATGQSKWRYQLHTEDNKIGAGISCRENLGNFHELMIELVHFEREAELSALIDVAR